MPIVVRFVNVPDTAVGERREWSVDDIKRLVDKWADPSVAVLLRQFVERVSGRGVRLEPECNGLPTADWWGVSSEGAQASDAWRGADQPASVCRSSRYYRCKGDGFSPTVVAVGVPVRAGAAPGQRGARLCGRHVLLRPSARRPFQSISLAARSSEFGAGTVPRARRTGMRQTHGPGARSPNR